MRKSILNILVLLAASLLLSCQSHKQAGTDVVPTPPPVVTAPESSTQTQCKSPRSQMCTREYRPVCATRDTGVRCVTTPCPSTEKVTKSNACTACADEKVFSYTEGACN